MAAKDLCNVSDNRRILLIGDIKRAFSDVDTVHRLGCEIRANMPDAIDIAARENFAVIGVVMSGSSARLSPALKALRQANSDARIILLAQMQEEPAAMQLVGTLSNGAALADDYLICPIQANRFYESIELGYRGREPSVAATAVVDTEREAKIKQLEKLATEDDLTGLKNRRYIWEFARQIIERARRRNERMTLLIFDIDNFKQYNDVYGHSVGDEILKQAAVLMRRCCRGHDVVGRVGGDEFAAIFWDDPQRKSHKDEAERRSALADHPKEAIFIANRFRKELEKAELGPHFAREDKKGTRLHLLGPKGRGVLTISGGLASFPRDGSTIQELFTQADSALLEAKRSGKNRIYLVGKPQSDIADVG